MRIFINSLPKSGTNLLSRAFDLARIPYARLGISSALVMGSWQLPRQLMRRSFFELDPLIIGLEVQMPLRRAWLDRRLSRVQSGSYVTGHANWNPGLCHLLERHQYRTVIVIRDPRDVLMSYVHYVASTPEHFLYAEYQGRPLWRRVETALEGGRIGGLDVSPFEVMLSRVDGWFSRTQATAIRFEDLVGNAGGGDSDAQDKTFRTLETLTGRHFDRSVMQNQLYGGSHTFRKGKVGSAVEELTRAQLDIVDNAIGSYRTKWGYTRV